MRLPWGTYRFMPLCMARDLGFLLAAVLLLVSAGRFVRPSSPKPDVSNEVARVERHSIFDEPEPLSGLFGLDRAASAPFALLSTLLGPRPRATVAVGESTFTVAVGDTIRGAVVDSIGRRVVIVRLDTEVIRVEL
ncbi:hypothetical protein JXA88_08550 [Candidatus Fermentibacteria bacterium]|nr:hypothetical protein [Candidatus Fermentibacteria bacterium]